MILRRIALAPIRFYQRFISPAFPPSCRYAPTCSNYAIGAIETHGILKGPLLAIWRILRCNPWSRGGVDEVPPRGSWRAPEWIPPDDWPGHLNLDPPYPIGLPRIAEWNDGTESDNAPASLHVSDHSASVIHADTRTQTLLRAPQTSPEFSGLTQDVIDVRHS
ncbi:MAG: membrane protein insertion efficiency factor YidD [Actinomycetaceae bacterium]|nr:membrane protein insertion efficiency factor YidD [Actinomycetaceae bacterium]